MKKIRFNFVNLIQSKFPIHWIPGLNGKRSRKMDADQESSTDGTSDLSYFRYTTADKLGRLRQFMINNGIHAYIIPTEDSHQSEYIAECDAKRKFISHFSGSAGTAVVTGKAAALWTDGRYFLQAAKQLDDNWILMKSGTTGTPTKDQWICSQLSKGDAVGVDPSLITVSAYDELHSQLAQHEIELKVVCDNLIDKIWITRPPRPANPIFALPLHFSGKLASEKIAQLQATITEHGCDCLVVTALDEICWLLNARGSDIQFNPVFFAFLIVPAKGKKILLYVLQGADGKRLMEFDASLSPSKSPNSNAQSKTGGIPSDLAVDIQYKVVVEGYDSFLKQLSILTKDIYKGKVMASSYSCTMSVVNAIGDVERIHRIDPSPISISKAVKNSVELRGFSMCHVRDGVAVVKFFAWLEHQLNQETPEFELNEVSVADKLEEFRSQQEFYQGPSFSTISGYASNGAIVHYDPQRHTAMKIGKDSMYLCDSGGQYLDGTTDITRTVHFGEPTSYEKFCYTLVLQGHVNLATALFPKGTTGHQLDVLARQPLWKHCMEYSHGTGHGVGHFLCVHEGPMGISPRFSPTHSSPGRSGISLEPGMILSNEPGYYESGSFGIRIESLVAVTLASDSKSTSQSTNPTISSPSKSTPSPIPAIKRRNSIICERKNSDDWLSFKTITMVPFARNLIEQEMLTQEQIEWINEYHQTVYSSVAPLLKDDELSLQWLRRETEPLV